jgi:putative transposase
MAIKWKHDDSCTMYYCTFTCYDWLPLFEMVNGYDMVYKWFDHLKTQNHYSTAFVTMPNHLHVILYFPEAGFNLNKIISNAKRFMAYEIIKRLQQVQKQDILNYLAAEVSGREKKRTIA